MKKLILLSAVLFATFMGYNANAQVSVNFNISTQPVWGPVGYDYVQYYYIPDIDAYYYVDRREYTYFSGGRWITSRYLPPMYRNYDLYHGYKVVVNEPRPWLHHDRYRKEYGQYRGRHDQPFIRDSRDERYYVNPRHPQHAQWQSTRPGGNTNRPQQVMPPRGNGPQQQGNPGHGHGNNDHKGNDDRRGNDDRGGNENHGGNDNRGGDRGHGNDKGGGHGHR